MSESLSLSDQSNAKAQDLTQVVWDAIVVGGGMVGAATALGLGQQGMHVLLLEKQPIDLTWQEDSPYQVRVSALTRASEKIIKNLGAWQGIYLWERTTQPKKRNLTITIIGE